VETLGSEATLVQPPPARVTARVRRSLAALLAGSLAAVLTGLAPPPAGAAVITEYPIPTAAAGPAGIAAGPDGALWFTEFFGNKIGRITTGGSVSEFPIPTADSRPNGIVAGPDGALWFTEFSGNKIGRVTTAGSFSEFLIPTPGSDPTAIAAGPDAALWFTERAANKIGRVTTTGSFSEFPIPTADSNPESIAAGPDAALWFTEPSANKIGRLDPTALPPSTPGCSTANNGLIIAQNGDRATFTGRAQTSSTGEASGTETYTDRGDVDRFVMRSTSIDALVCTGRDASIFGQARVNGGALDFQIDLHDGAGAHMDTYRIRLSNGYDSGSQSLRRGYVRVR
jgi:hypothetical protein